MADDTAPSSERLQRLIAKRVATLQYIKLAHEGRVRWLNVHELAEGDFLRSFDGRFQKRLSTWFSLGRSLAQLNDDPCVAEDRFVGAVGQLCEEYEHVFGSSIKLGLSTKSIRAKDFVAKEGAAPAKPEELFDKPSIFKFGKSVLMQYLITEDAGESPLFPLDYREVVFALCDTLSQTYVRFSHSDMEQNALFAALRKADKVFKKEFFGWISKQMTSLSVVASKEQLASPMTLMDTFRDAREQV